MPKANSSVSIYLPCPNHPFKFHTSHSHSFPVTSWFAIQSDSFSNLTFFPIRAHTLRDASILANRTQSIADITNPKNRPFPVI
mmetsp:Transcript_23544/g.39450  ORF Transcript_23544/g.39450 Transcript_23544/m.39450 type:complete len:83 (+) Transcript_23544:354-602(+)